VVTPQWIQQVVDSYATDSFTTELLSKLAIDPLAVPHYSLKDGIIRYYHRIWVGANPLLHQKLLQACHSSALGGHSGFSATYAHMKQLFAWKGMKTVVREFVSSCLTCQQAKPDRARLLGLL
jgi:hypothetical protein